ncbi:MltR family transcriptional regulator [Corallococcus llansteffanensis]|uniref:Transcriptional regulator n=1 Tax=Corallococcus llansteffanensis TaxID=2316731 RepID=A0A3A8Q206_9BACT|nr:MltR family transcriptional regulator [Corallococcus llansteffanensis]RKH61461.1 hypothetical protein D7V93_11740 [Corallococcus llansteffanensis]
MKSPKTSNKHKETGKAKQTPPRISDKDALKEMASRDLGILQKSVEAETDRGCVLVIAAYIDEELEKILRAFFVDDVKIADELLGTDKPLGTFSSRSKACFALGLITRETYNAIGLLRKTRNEFAHLKEEASLASPPIVNRIKELPLPLNAEAAKSAKSAKSEAPRDRFISCMIALIVSIHLSLLIDKQRVERRLPTSK